MIGQTLNDVYRVSEKVGSGGFADVYLGRDLRTNTVVAIKILHEHFASDPALVERFLHEADFAEALVEPHVVRVLDHGSDGDVYYIVMEYVQGHTLAHLVKTSGPLEVGAAVGYVSEMLLALGAAHRAGIVHRDIKPQNVMVTAGGLVKVMDFGIAKDVAASGAAQTTMYLGTPRYMSPEQANGEPASPRSDLYAVAVTLFELLAGQPPFDADTPWKILNLQMTATPPPISQFRSDVPREVVQTLARGLEKSPDRRFQTAEEMLAALTNGVPETDEPTIVGLDGAPAERTVVAGLRGPAVSSRTIGAPTTPVHLSRKPEPTPVRSAVQRPSAPANTPAGRWLVTDESSRKLGSALPWIVAGSAVVALLIVGALFLRTGSPPAVPASTPAPTRTRANPTAVATPGEAASPATTAVVPAATPANQAAVSSPVATASAPVPFTVKTLGAPPGTPLPFYRPYGLTTGSRGDVYVVDAANDVLSILTSAGNLRQRIFEGGASLESEGERSIDRDDQGNLYISDTGQDRVRKRSPSGQVLASWGRHGSGPGQFSGPDGIVVDPRGNVYVVDSGNNRVQWLSPIGGPLAQWGTKGTGPGQFNGPTEMTTDYQGNVYVVDTGNNRIQKLTPDGKPLAQWGSKGSGPGQFDHPTAVDVDPQGNVYVVDSGNARVEKLSPSGAFLAQWGGRGDGPGQFQEPHGIVVDSDGSVYVADPVGRRIVKTTSDGKLLADWRPRASGSGQFSFPMGVAVDLQDNVYVADTNNGRIQKLSTAGTPVASWGAIGSGPGQFQLPTGLAVDVQGNVYVADSNNNRVQKLSPDGKPLASWGTRGSAPGQFYFPHDVAVDAHGNVFVADTENDRIQKLSANGAPLAQWGTEGDGLDQFERPEGLALDADGNVYVADTGNDRITKLSPDGKPVAQWGTRGDQPGQFEAPVAVAVDAHGNIFVADRDNRRVQEISSNGTPLAQWPISGASSVDSLPTLSGIAVDSQGTVIVSDSLNDRVMDIVPAR